MGRRARLADSAAPAGDLAASRAIAVCTAYWSQKKADYTDVAQRAEAIVDRAEFPDASKLNQTLTDGDDYAFVTILLSQLHNLQSLRLDYGFVWRPGIQG
ncbi:uncharacterized protein ACHE_10867A [Aspergillus chevalieri]|uniref:Uncharacterized protein n=1 Tax=Aspergillus chevalieri TaxID=182096 RepID=A0A7R7ZIA9_ASPCH|nr:uncharacterized protein ACHE_10867A [Aspergillus chevalieri]BCR83465.1 hypothetical protein ACHE_10867A [Aspergillus chevalieri]